jgi:hypothetical protein
MKFNVALVEIIYAISWRALCLFLCPFVCESHSLWNVPRFWYSQHYGQHHLSIASVWVSPSQVNMSATSAPPSLTISFCSISTFKVLLVFNINLINIPEDWLFLFNSSPKGRPVLELWLRIHNHCPESGSSLGTFCCGRNLNHTLLCNNWFQPRAISSTTTA